MIDSRITNAMDLMRLLQMLMFVEEVKAAVADIEQRPYALTETSAIRITSAHSSPVMLLNLQRAVRELLPQHSPHSDNLVRLQQLVLALKLKFVLMKHKDEDIHGYCNYF
jgi:hypothetical protein